MAPAVAPLTSPRSALTCDPVPMQGHPRSLLVRVFMTGSLVVPAVVGCLIEDGEGARRSAVFRGASSRVLDDEAEGALQDGVNGGRGTR